MDNRDQLLQHFVDTWPLERLHTMTLEEYNQQGNKTTFCYMLEYGTRSLGNISGGATSAKFEIYERVNKERVPNTNDYRNDESYTWRKRAGETRKEAFIHTRNIIIFIVEAAISRKFHKIKEKIEGKKFAPTVIWKIAFIYSNKQLLSISYRPALQYIAESFGMENYLYAPTAAIHRFLMQTVERETYWQSMDDYWQLYDAFRKRKEDLTNLDKIADANQESGGTDTRNTETSKRIIAAKTILIQKRHNKLQQ